jgi:hypothetical protein
MSLFKFNHAPDLHTQLMGDIATGVSEASTRPSVESEEYTAPSAVTDEDDQSELTAEEVEYEAEIAELVSDMKELSIEELLDDAADDMARGDYEHDCDEIVEATAYYIRAAAVGNRALALILLGQQTAPHSDQA